ncbi:protein kinase [Streptomyces sp. NBC_00193]|uniref:protein kinase domain-containing protein n=1 Tax=unclassified Streptomyces TaxID=2593676 RepID=UPI00224CD35E|nr:MULTISPECIES: protein kinase [unclassified Streptomyces]MCX5122321.1 protein kinase [Streptomyces sp. NBC_00347]MCX5295667.1 protein kinase [Streptomyces sp. NBC_00193]
MLRSIGRGGEAVLYLAEIELAGGSEPVVVKVLDSKTTITPDVFDRISQKWNEQAELLRFVHRPGVVGVREHFEGPPIHRPGESSTLTGRALVLVMNHVDGLDLRDWRAERTLATAAERREVMRTLEQLADVLDWLHSGKATPSGRQVIHGDLSPGNVMVDAHGQATLVDFGLSKLTADHQTAEVWFTQGYAAPEVFEGKRTPGADRYAFGAIAYFLLSGESPPSTPELLAHALLRLPQFAVLDAEQRARIASIYAADPLKRPVNLAGWMKDIRRAVVSTTSSTSQRVVQDAVPVPPAASPAPASAPPRPVAPPQQPSQPPAAPAAPPAQPVYAPPPTEPVYTPPPVQASVPQGYGPAPAAESRTEPAPAPPRKKRRTGLVLGAVLTVLVLAAAALAGMELLKDKDKEASNNAGGDQPTSSASASVSPSPSPTPTPTPTPTPSATPSPRPSTDPTVAVSPTPPGPNSKEASLLALEPLRGGFGSAEAAKMDTKRFNAAFIACRGTAEYDINKDWVALDFTAGMDDSSFAKSGQIIVSGDDIELFSESVERGKPVTRTVNVTGVLILRVEFRGSCSDSNKVVMASPTLRR